MKLADYIQSHNMKPSAFADRLNVPASTVLRLLNGERSPGLDLLKKIAEATDGAVMPNDFLDELTDTEAAE